MEINGKQISEFIAKSLKKEIKKLKKRHPFKLTTFLIGESDEQLSFVKIKSKMAKKLGIGFELIHIKKTPSFEEFAHKIKEASLSDTAAIIIQQPLPAQLSTDSLYDFIDITKEIEGHKRKTPFLPPIGLAVLTVLKYVFNKPKLTNHLIIDANKDRRFFKKIFRNKRVVLVGRGITGGKPIGRTLSEVKINYISINASTPESFSYYKEADVIITAVGKKVISPAAIKPGAVLINVGLRKEAGKLKGDYDEREIKNITSFYTPTPGGVGPIDVIYLFKNLIDAVKLQKRAR